jgi:cobalt-zinc-cadmium efflux system membrane fusion protein
MNKYILLCIIVLSFACKSKVDKQESSSYTLNGDTIIVNVQSPLSSKLKVETISAEPYKINLTISGVVKAIPNNYAEVASPFAGRITKSFVRLGQYVDIDSPIFEISSPSYFEAGKMYYQSKQELQLAEKNLRRQKDLFSNGVGTQKDMEEAELAYELSRRDLENAIASLKVYHVNPDELVLGQPLIVRSPIKGEIVENNIVIGQYLKEDAEPVAIVAELSEVWVIGQLKEKYISSVSMSDEVEIRLIGMPEEHIHGKVFHIGEMLDETTRSVQIYILCKNHDRIMKPGMYVSTQYSEIEHDAILIPTNSIYQTGNSNFVFLHKGGNKFLRKTVEVAGTDNNRIIIKTGLVTGDQIVVDGGSLMLDINTIL